MARKVILDVDPGIADAVALTMALFDPRLDVVAVTAVGGNVSPEQATRNVQGIIEQLDPPRWPRVGAAIQPERTLPADTSSLNGADGLGNAEFVVSELHHQHPSDKVIADAVRAAPDEVTFVALGPLTNLASAFRRDPTLAAQIGQVIIMGGTLTGAGNVTPAAEFNIYSDPFAARTVFHSSSTMTLVPLEVASKVIMNFGHLDQLPSESTKAGKFLRRILPFAFRTHRQELGLEGIYLHDAVALLAVTQPELFQTERMAGDVETQGEMTQGATVFDRRRMPLWRHNMYAATDLDNISAMDAIMRGLAQAGKAG